MKSILLKIGPQAHRLALVGLLRLFLGVGLAKSMTVELADGPDEVTHFTFTRFVAQHRRLPLSGEEQSMAGYKADVPPLFYVISGLLGSMITLDAPPYVKLTIDNPRLQLVFGLKNIKAWRALNTEDPLRGEILLWYLGRWLSLLFGMLALIGLYGLIRATQPDAAWLAVAGTALLAFLPTYLFISSVLSYESLTGALLAFYFLALFYLIQNPGKSWLTFVTAVLLGADLPQRSVQQGQALPLTLHWQALRNIGADLVMFNHLISRDGDLAASRDRRAREVYSTMLWVPDEVVTDPFFIPVEANAPDGIYQLLVGIYLPVGDAPVALPLLQDGAMSDVTHVALGPIKVGNTPPGLTVAAANPTVQLDQPLGDGPQITLLGYSLDNEQDAKNNGQRFTLRLYWRSEAPLSLDYTTFVHLRNSAGETIAQQDQPPLNGAYPTGLWEPGEIIADEIALSLPPDLAAGDYTLVIGLYDFNSGARLTVPGIPANEVTLTNVSLK